MTSTEKHWNTAAIPSLEGQLALVTGANAGLGYEIARALGRAGATVILGCRNMAKAEEAASSIRKDTDSATIEVLPLDLGDLSSVRRAADQFLASDRPLNLLINNAGLMALDQSKTVDGFETQFGVNHLGHFALTSDILPALLRTPNSRVVNMSSMGHRMGKMTFDDLMHERKYDRWTPYFQSKLANILFTMELQSRLGVHNASNATSVVALAAHPGASTTELGKQGSGLTNKAMSLVVPMTTQPASIGAHPALRAATDPNAKGGEYYGPRWMTRGFAVLETPSKRARESADAKRLWTMSEALTNRTLLAGS